MKMFGVFTKAGKLIAASPSIKAAGFVFAMLCGSLNFEPYEIKQVELPDPQKGAQI